MQVHHLHIMVWTHIAVGIGRVDPIDITDAFKVHPCNQGINLGGMGASSQAILQDRILDLRAGWIQNTQVLILRLFHLTNCCGWLLGWDRDIPQGRGDIMLNGVPAVGGGLE